MKSETKTLTRVLVSFSFFESFIAIILSVRIRVLRSHFSVRIRNLSKQIKIH